MKLIFGALATFVVLMVSLSGLGVFWLSTSILEDTKKESVAALATGLAYGLSSQMQLFEQTVNQMASDEDVIAAIESGDTALIDKTAAKVRKFLPVALKVRLLPTTVSEVDEREIPVMGYADLEMVKKTLTAKQPATIQGEGNNKHLAVTASIKKGEQVIGVVLASLKFEFIQEILSKAPINNNFIEISQADMALASIGNSQIKDHDSPQFAVANSPWKISYAAASPFKLSNVSIITGLIIGLSALSCIALFLGYYYMNVLLKGDQNKVLEAVKDLMTGKELKGYMVKLDEMQVIISTLLQFKRILDNKHSKEGGGNHIKLDESDLLHPDMIEDDTALVAKKSVSGLFSKKKSLLNP